MDSPPFLFIIFIITQIRKKHSPFLHFYERIFLNNYIFMSEYILNHLKRFCQLLFLFLEWQLTKSIITFIIIIEAGKDLFLTAIACFFFILSSISIIIVLTFQSIRRIILVKKWGFTVLYDTTCSFLFFIASTS